MADYRLNEEIPATGSVTVMAGVSTTDGKPREISTDTDGKININATIQTGDIEIGAVEIKNATTDTRANVLAASTAAVATDTPLVVALHPSSPLPAGTAAIGKLAANSGVDIGDVDVTSLPALAAGTASIGSTKDNGPTQTVTRTYTASADMTTAAAITPAPTGGEKIVLMDLLISTDTAMNVLLEEETSGTDLDRIYLAANTPVPVTMRGYQIKVATADKKITAKASVAGNIAIKAVTFSET